MLTSEHIRECLRSVIDPELNINIVDLGLLYDIQVVAPKPNEPYIFITMTLTTPGCPLGVTFDRMVRDALATLPNINPERDAKITLTFDPPWIPDMMSEEAKAELGL